MITQSGFYRADGGCRIAWRKTGESAQPALVLLNSIGTDMSSWDAALNMLAAHHCILQIDTRGHGGSDVPGGDYSLAILASDVVGAMDAAGITNAAVAGVSLGGMIAMQMALDWPARVSALMLICTSATMDPAAWSDRIARVRSDGTSAIADMAMDRFFAPGFAQAHPAQVALVGSALIAMDDAGYAGAGAAIRDMELASRLHQIAKPTLVIAGDRDISTPFEPHGATLAATIPGASVAHVDAAHLAQIEASDEVARLINQFLNGVGK